jgi:YD repeat-containing protein
VTSAAATILLLALPLTTLADQNITYTYNAQGQVLTIDGPRTDLSDITTFGYDAQGNRTSITNALGHVTQITAHDDNGRPLTIVDPNGVTTELTYDGRGRLLTRTTYGQTTAMQYDEVGNITRITQPGGSYIEYEYDAANRLIAISDTVGNRIAYTLDAAGNRTKEEISDPSSQLTKTHSSSYDALSRLREQIGAAAQTTLHEYDPEGNRTKTTDANSNPTAWAFDALNRMTEATDALNGNTLYTYDAQDNLTSVTDPNGNTTTYSYDGLGNLLSQQSPDTGTTTYTYDDAGNRVSQTDARGIVSNYSYDALNRILSIQYPADSSQNITYSYDEIDVSNGIGRLTTTDDASGTTRYHYDARGNTTKVVTTLGGNSHTVEYAYDGANNLVRITYPSGRTVDYTDLNSDNRTDQVSLDDQGANTVLANNIEYLPFGPMSSMEMGNNTTQSRSHDLDYILASLSMPELEVDSDGDGISDSSDNCPFASNPDQQDSGGMNTTEPDGIGDACQCGDVNNNGLVDNTDAVLIKRYVLGLPPGVDLNKCNINAGNTCDNTDAVLIQRAVLGLPPGITQSCPAAVGNGGAQ